MAESSTHESLYLSAISALARIDSALGLPDDGCNSTESTIQRIEDMKHQINSLLAHCPDPECATCGEIICPDGNPGHFHHDGCGVCGEGKGMCGEDPTPY